MFFHNILDIKNYTLIILKFYVNYFYFLLVKIQNKMVKKLSKVVILKIYIQSKINAHLIGIQIIHQLIYISLNLFADKLLFL